MKMNDYELSMRWSNRTRSIPEISVQRKLRRVQTVKEMKNEKDESWAFFLEKERKKERKQVNYKLVETNKNDEKADVDQETKCSTRQEQNDKKTCLWFLDEKS